MWWRMRFINTNKVQVVHWGRSWFGKLFRSNKSHKTLLYWKILLKENFEKKLISDILFIEILFKGRNRQKVRFAEKKTVINFWLKVTLNCCVVFFVQLVLFFIWRKKLKILNQKIKSQINSKSLFYFLIKVFCFWVWHY